MRALASALLIAGLVGNIQVTFAQSVMLPDVANLRGLNYGPFRDGESPALGIFPTAEELQQDVLILSGRPI